MNFFLSFHSIFQNKEFSGREEVEDAGWEEDLEVAGREESSGGEQEDSKEEEDDMEEGHEEDAGLDDEGVGDGFASESVSTRRFRSSHLIRPSIAPHGDNMVVIIPCGDG
jgi:hypothetical protein